MAKYALLGGKHTDPDTGKVYDAGDGSKGPPRRQVVVTSDKPLDEMFRNKFERLDGPTAYGPEGEDSEADYTTADPPTGVKQKLDRAKNTGGRDNAPKAERNPGQSVRKRAELMDQETDEDGDSEDSKPVRAAVAEKVKQQQAKAAEPPDEDDDEEAEETEAEEGEEAKPARAARGGRTARMSRTKKSR